MRQATDDPLVTVIVPSYNHAPYVEACIESILGQTYPNIELLVIDDGSTDDSVERIRRLQERHGFDFRVQRNQGLLTTLNDALQRARGVYFAPFASDDVMLPERIERQVRHLQAHPEVAICAGNVQAIDPEGRLVGKPRSSRATRRLDFDSLFLGTQDGAPAPTLLLRRDVALAVGGYDPSIRIEDLTMQLKMARAGYFVDVLGDVLALYRTHPENMHRNLRFMLDEGLKIYALFADHPAYRRVCMAHRNSILLKAAKLDKPLAWEILRQIPPAHWTRKTLRALLRLLLARR